VILSDTSPRLDVVDHGDSVRVHLNDEHSLLISTAIQAHELADCLRRAANYLDDRARLLSERREREAARAVNVLHEQENRSWGATLTLTPKPVVIDACECTRLDWCADHSGDVA
jgi:hypothetical protein